ncbi:MAG: serine hydroxymethyltransferase, partial [Butyricicoccus sp.]|nr:serine hydroxymethyltransferase [Butyricicoccus sp.]
VDLRKAGVTGKVLQNRLDEVYITANKNTIPNDPESPFVTSGMRIGTPAVTTRGFGAPEMLRIAEFVWQTATDFEAKAGEIRANVTEMCSRFPIYR